MRKHAAGRIAWLLPIAAVVALAGAVAANGVSRHSAASSTLVIDNSFTLKTSDPQRAFDPTGSIIDRALFDTLFTYKGSDLAHPIPLLVRSWKASKNAKTFTFQLKRNAHFADGTPLTSADVVFSYRRLVSLKGNPSFLLAGVTTRAAGPYTVVMHSATPNTALPAILANPSTGIVNSKLVKAHGGSDAGNAAKADKAESWLNSSSSVGAGSGPYVLSSFSTTSQVTLTPNTKYWGPKKPAFSSVVVRNMIAPTQLINIQRGSHEIAIDLSADQAKGLQGKKNLKVALTPSTWVFWLFTNDNPQVSSITSNKQFQQAVRFGLDYKSILSVAGPGAIQAPGIIPSMFLGSLPQSARVNQDVAKAKAALQASGAQGQSVQLEYPSDLTINGVPFTTLAQKVQANLNSLGFNITLSGSPTSNWLTKYRDGKMAFGLSLWGPDYPDPADYLTFAPGQLVGVRVGWPKNSDPSIEKLAAKLLVTTSPTARKSLYQQYQRQLNLRGPYFPLMQPTQVFVSTTDLRNAVYNAEYSVDVTQLSPK
ncbi:MAG TPA: ABC transporter substrate-binding protein [Gaiellaceae bacterium]|nr:ABC transporter substrate-binding protein [Gaiellaceae bacterium]